MEQVEAGKFLIPLYMRGVRKLLSRLLPEFLGREAIHGVCEIHGVGA